MSVDVLLAEFKIGHDDLLANHDGRLSSRQITALNRQAARMGAAVSLTIFGLAALVFFAFLRPLIRFEIVYVTVFAIAATGTGRHLARHLRQAAREGVVERVTGRVTVARRRWRGVWITVTGRSYRLPIDDRLIVSGTAYRVYVAPAAGRVVAMEPDA